MFYILKMMKKSGKGFTLIEVIVSLVVVGILGAGLAKFLQTGFIKSANPVIMTKSGSYLSGIMEQVNSDYLYQMTNAANLRQPASTGLTNFKTHVDAGTYYGGTTSSSCVTFTGSPLTETAATCTFGSGNVYLKVTATYAGRSATALFME